MLTIARLHLMYRPRPHPRFDFVVNQMRNRLKVSKNSLLVQRKTKLKNRFNGQMRLAVYDSTG